MTELPGPVREVQGSLMRLNPNDSGISADLEADGIREAVTTERYRSLLRDLPGPLTVLDVGANIGYYALMPAALRDDVRVLAIEPDPESRAYLNHNVDLNGYGDRMTVIGYGVAPFTGTATLHRFDMRNANSMSDAKADKYREYRRGTVDVPVRPLDDIVAEHGIDHADVDVIRMDVEGYDYEALTSALGILSAVDRCLLCIEVHPALLTDEQNAGLEALLSERPAEVILAAQNHNVFDVESVSELFDYNCPEAIIRWG